MLIQLWALKDVNESSGSVKDKVFLCQLSDFQLLKEDSDSSTVDSNTLRYDQNLEPIEKVTYACIYL